jgi:hypothetical protein
MSTRGRFRSLKAPTSSGEPDSLIMHITNVSGNFYDATRFCNLYELTPYVVQFTITGGYTQIVLRLPASLRDKLVGEGKMW